MTEVHRYKVVKMVTSGGNKLTYTPHGPEIVMGEAYDALMTRFVDVDNLRNEAEDVAERMTAQFDALAEAVGFTQSRCEQTGDSPLDCAQQLVKQRDALQQRLAEAEKKIDDAADLLRRAKQMVPVLQYNWHANTDALLSSPNCAAGENRTERGSEHGFEQSPNSCRHDEKIGVWWRERGVTRTGRECVDCGHVDEDGGPDGKNS